LDLSELCGRELDGSLNDGEFKFSMLRNDIEDCEAGQDKIMAAQYVDDSCISLGVYDKDIQPEYTDDDEEGQTFSFTFRHENVDNPYSDCVSGMRSFSLSFVCDSETEYEVEQMVVSDDVCDTDTRILTLYACVDVAEDIDLPSVTGMFEDVPSVGVFGAEYVDEQEDEAYNPSTTRYTTTDYTKNPMYAAEEEPINEDEGLMEDETEEDEEMFNEEEEEEYIDEDSDMNIASGRVFEAEYVDYPMEEADEAEEEQMFMDEDEEDMAQPAAAENEGYGDWDHFSSGNAEMKDTNKYTMSWDDLVDFAVIFSFGSMLLCLSMLIWQCYNGQHCCFGRRKVRWQKVQEIDDGLDQLEKQQMIA